MLIKNSHIPTETLDIWDAKILPDFDLLFFPDNSKSIIEKLGSNVLVFSTEDFFQSSNLKTIDVINSYQLWGIKKQLISFVCVVHPSVLPTLEKETLTEIFRLQKQINSGMIFERRVLGPLLDSFQHTDLVDRYSFEVDSVQWFTMHRSLWNLLDQEIKYAFIIHFAEQFVDEITIEASKFESLKDRFPHLAPYFNTFATDNGANCIAAALAGVSGKNANTDWLISHWVFAETLLIAMKTNNYRKQSFNESDLQPGDVLLWKDNQDNVIHATYHMEDGYFFNKHGQMLFNPWQVISIDNLYETWGKEGIELYRRK